MIGRFRSILFVSVFQGSLAVAKINCDDGSEKKKNPIVSWALNFRVRMLLKTTIIKAQVHKLEVYIDLVLFWARTMSFASRVFCSKPCARENDVVYCEQIMACTRNDIVPTTT